MYTYVIYIQSRHFTRTIVVPARVLPDLVCALFLSCLVPFRRRTEGLLEEDVDVGPVHGGASRALLILSLEAPRSARRGFDLIRLILWHYLDYIYIYIYGGVSLVRVSRFLNRWYGFFFIREHEGNMRGT